MSAFALPMFLALASVFCGGGAIALLGARVLRRIGAARAGRFRPPLDLADPALLTALAWVFGIMTVIALGSS